MTDNLPATVVQAELIELDGDTLSDPAQLISELAQLAQEMGESPAPIGAGTFAVYPMIDGGMMVVTAIDTGPMAGVKHMRVRPNLMRAMSILVGGGSKTAAIKALVGIGRKEITGG